MRPCPFSTSMWSFSLRFTTGGTSPRFLASTCRAMLRGNWIYSRPRDAWSSPSGTLDVHATMRDDHQRSRRTARGRCCRRGEHHSRGPGPAGGWHRDCYLLRNRIVHKGHKPTSGEAFDSKVATGEFARWIGAVLEGDPRVADVKSFLQARPPSRPA